MKKIFKWAFKSKKDLEIEKLQAIIAQLREEIAILKSNNRHVKRTRNSKKNR